MSKSIIKKIEDKVGVGFYRWDMSNLNEIENEIKKLVIKAEIRVLQDILCGCEIDEMIEILKSELRKIKKK